MVKGKSVFLCLIKHYTVNTHGEVEVLLQEFFIPSTRWSWVFSFKLRPLWPGEIPIGTHRKRGWVRPRVDPPLEQMKSVSLLGTGVMSPVVRLITVALYRLNYPGARNLSGAHSSGLRKKWCKLSWSKKPKLCTLSWFKGKVVQTILVQET